MADNKDKKLLNVPHLRFPEFSREWEKCKFSDVCSFFSGGTPSSSKKEYYDGSIPFIRSGEIHMNKTELLITKEGLNNSAAKIVEIGDLLLALYGATSGDIAISQINRAINQAILCVRTTQNKKFIESVWKKHVNRLLQTYLQGGQGNLSADIVKNISFYFAADNEQNKLARFVSLLDERIATQNKVIEKLQSLIKGIADKLLCNFSWGKVYLRSFMEFYPTNSFSWEQLSYEKGTIRNLHYGLIHSISTKSVVTQTLPFISSHKDVSKFVCCQNGDVAFADASEDTSDIGKAIEVTDVDNNNILCGLHTIHGRDVKGLTVTGFKGFLFNSSYFHKQVSRVAQGTKVFSISANNLSSCYVYIPDKSEQTKITGLLRAMEMKLSLSKKLLERYKTQKEHLLRQMFI